MGNDGVQTNTSLCRISHNRLPRIAQGNGSVFGNRDLEGSTSERLVRHCPVSVLIVRDDPGC
jgi:hypothetical protein